MAIDSTNGAARAGARIPTPDQESQASESYFGGKCLAFRHLVNQIPPHETLVVPFAGHCAIVRNMRLPRSVIVNDRDVDVFQWWCRHLEATPPHRESEYSDRIRVTMLCGLTLIGREACNLLSDPDCFLYCDPPYLLETRKSGARYRCELTADDHRSLLFMLRELSCKVMLSGYWSELYASHLADWRHFSFRSQTRGGPATEHVWCNYPEPTELQDYRWLGRNRRERFKLARREQNLIAKLSALPEIERNALLSAVDSVFRGGRSRGE